MSSGISESHGRRHTRHLEGLHPWPIDSGELLRQEQQFDLHYQLFQGKLPHASIQSPRTVLDIRTGVGHWAMEFAKRNPHSKVIRLDFIARSAESPLANVQSIVDSFLRPLWHQAYNQVDLIHIGELHGDVQLLRQILMGAYDCCAPNGTIEICGTSVRFDDPNGDTALHRLYRDMSSAYEKSGRCLDLPSKYASEVKRRGFVHVAERAYVLPLTTRGNIDLLNDIIANWADGFEAYSLELLITELGKRYLEIFSGYASARQSLRKGVDGYLEIWIVQGKKGPHDGQNNSRMVAESLAS